MMNLYSIFTLISAVLGLGLAIPSNTCIVIVNLESIRKKDKLSPSDVIFMAKGMVNILLQCFLSLREFFCEVLYIKEFYAFVNTSVYFLAYFNFWMTFWLSAHYCTNITNLNYRVFTCLKRIVSNFLNQILFLTALGMFIVNVLGILGLHAERTNQSSENSTEARIIRVHVSLPCLMSVTFLGCILTFCLSLLCLLLTFSFLVRHVWRVRNNDSGTSRPNLEAHITALRTIFFLLLIFTFFCISQVLMFIRKSPQNFSQPVAAVSWTLRILSPLVEAAVIFQARNKLKRIVLRRFWTRSWRNSDT